MAGGCHYWELCPLLDWKSFSVGVAYRASLGRFDQLGKSGGSWCLHASQWLQTSLSVKHNNRAKALDWPLPQRIGIYCDCSNGTGIRLLLIMCDAFGSSRVTNVSVSGDLIFIDVDRLRLLHAFKAKFSQPLVPAFTVSTGPAGVSPGSVDRCPGNARDPVLQVWCGGISVITGLQVPSFMGNFLSTNRSLSSLSQ